MASYGATVTVTMISNNCFSFALIFEKDRISSFHLLFVDVIYNDYSKQKSNNRNKYIPENSFLFTDGVLSGADRT